MSHRKRATSAEIKAMSAAFRSSTFADEAGALPHWYRRALILVALLILCSCRAGGVANNSASQVPDPFTASGMTSLEPRAAQQPLPGPQQVSAMGQHPVPPQNAAATQYKQPNAAATQSFQAKQQAAAAAAQPAGQVIPATYVPQAALAAGTPLPGGHQVVACQCGAPEHNDQPANHQATAASHSIPILAGPEPCLACGGVNGPLVGPSDEYLCDGGDFGLPAGVRGDWSIAGLDPEDAVAHYDTIDGDVVVVPSNRVCIYAPRFAAVRRVTMPQVHERNDFVNAVAEQLVPVGAADAERPAMSMQQHAPAQQLGEQPASLLRGRQQAGGTENLLGLLEVQNSLSAYANLQIVRSGIVANHEGPLVAEATVAAQSWASDQAAQVLIDNRQAVELASEQHTGTLYKLEEPNSPRLRLLKLASCGSAAPGEEVEFVLRFDNTGDREIGNVTIVDNLTTRLEYIPDSAESSVPAQFFTEPNSAGSLLLRWEIRDPVGPGEGGVLRFRTRVL